MLYLFLIPLLFFDFFRWSPSFNISVNSDSSPLIFSICFSILICHLGFPCDVLRFRCFGVLPTLSEITKAAAYNSWFISLSDFPCRFLSNIELLSLINAFIFLVKDSFGNGGLSFTLIPSRSAYLLRISLNRSLVSLVSAARLSIPSNGISPSVCSPCPNISASLLSCVLRLSCSICAFIWSISIAVSFLFFSMYRL